MIEADERRSFGSDERGVGWVWAVLDADTRPVVAVAAGGWTEATARRLWAALPREYRDGATVCTDVLARYRATVPAARHVAAGKAAGLTNHVELVRKTLSFPMCSLNHIGALWYFIRLYNASLP